MTKFLKEHVVLAGKVLVSLVCSKIADSAANLPEVLDLPEAENLTVSDFLTRSTG